MDLKEGNSEHPTEQPFGRWKMERIELPFESLEYGFSDLVPIGGQPRPLTHDERKAAEAAFRGKPFDPTWSTAALKVYQGISAAMVRKGMSSGGDAGMESALPGGLALAEF
jgi:hypothetical protein